MYWRDSRLAGGQGCFRLRARCHAGTRSAESVGAHHNITTQATRLWLLSTCDLDVAVRSFSISSASCAQCQRVGNNPCEQANTHPQGANKHTFAMTGYILEADAGSTPNACANSSKPSPEIPAIRPPIVAATPSGQTALQLCRRRTWAFLQVSAVDERR